jgi:hypothetical protein
MSLEITIDIKPINLYYYNKTNKWGWMQENDFLGESSLCVHGGMSEDETQEL